MKEYRHLPRNINFVIMMEQKTASFNQRFAIGMTKLFSSMVTFWVIFLWIVCWIAINFTVLRFDPLPWPLLLCLASVPQLPLMIVIMVGQGLISHRQELHVEEQYQMTMKIYHDMEQMGERLSKIEEYMQKAQERS